MKAVIRTASLAFLIVGSALRVAAAPINIDVPKFVIPIGGEIGTLDLYSDGRAPETTGFNALGGRQRLTLQPHSVSSGSLTLNLHFLGLDYDDVAFNVSGASLRWTVDDVDFLGHRIRNGTVLTETAALTAINGVPLPTAMSFRDQLPGDTRRTQNQRVSLSPLLLGGAALPASFAEPLVLSFTLTATVVNNASTPIRLINSPEQIASDISLTLVPATIPEPSTYAILGVGVLWLAFTMRRRR